MYRLFFFVIYLIVTSVIMTLLPDLLGVTITGPVIGEIIVKATAQVIGVGAALILGIVKLAI